MNFYTNNIVKTQNINPKYNNKIGKVKKWVNSTYYIVIVDDVELLLDSSKDEMILIERAHAK